MPEANVHGFSKEIPSGLPLLRGPRRKVDLVPSATMSSRPAYQMIHERAEGVQKQVQELTEPELIPPGIYQILCEPKDPRLGLTEEFLLQQPETTTVKIHNFTNWGYYFCVTNPMLSSKINCGYELFNHFNFPPLSSNEQICLKDRNRLRAYQDLSQDYSKIFTVVPNDCAIQDHHHWMMLQAHEQHVIYKDKANHFLRLKPQPFQGGGNGMDARTESTSLIRIRMGHSANTGSDKFYWINKTKIFGKYTWITGLWPTKHVPERGRKGSWQILPEQSQ